MLDFNVQYDGYYPSMDFRAVAVGGGSVMVAGVRPDGTPAAFTSSRGTVWSERILDYSDNIFTAVPMDLSYDPAQDRFYLLGDGGSQLALPGCSHCNTLTHYPVDTLLARCWAATDSSVWKIGRVGMKSVTIFHYLCVLYKKSE